MAPGVVCNSRSITLSWSYESWRINTLFPSAQDIENTFQRDIDEIAKKAIAAYGLTFTQSAKPDLSEPLLRWADFTMRYIAPVRRQILVSKKFPLALPPEPEVGLHRIEQLLIWGDDVNPYQSRTLTQFNDTSGSKSQKRTDGLWADWGIHHLHLPLKAVAPGQTYSDRSGWLLFLMVYSNVALFIDVKEHSEENLFSLRELVETYIRNWPDDAERYRLKGALGLAWDKTPTDAEHRKLRDLGVSTMLDVDGKVYVGPGMGVTTAVTSTRVSLLRDRIRSNTRLIAQEVARVDGQYLKEMQALGITSPEFDLAFLSEGDLGIHEKVSNQCWRVPRQNADRPNNDLLSTWHNEFMPSWAGKKLAQYLAAKP